MKSNISLYIFIFIILLSHTNNYADTQWTGTSGTIPTDDVYYVSTEITLIGHLTIPNTAILEIRDGGKIFTGEGATIFNYSLLENGDASGPGTINIEHSGSLYLLSGTLTNNHADSVVNVNLGGSLYNYYGTIDLNLGGNDSLDIKAGGKFDNVRGNNPATFTIATGGNFSDSNEISLDNNLDIDYTWTITDVAVINGYGNKITLGTNGAIVIEKDASLLLNEVVIDNASSNKIRCTDNNSTLSIHNVAWTQDTNFSFTKGMIYASGYWLIQGKGTEFSFETDQIMTISSNATLHMFMTKFNYNSNTANLLNLFNNTSKIKLEHATLKASKSCNLANGSIQITGLGTLQGDATLNLQNISSLNIAGSLERIGTVII